MDRSDPNERLSEMSTQTTLIFQAHHGTPEEADQALGLLMLRYSGAIHRYLLKAVGDPEAAKDLNQEFSVKFLSGGFRSFDPSRGRFRDYIKRAVHNMMVDHFRKKKDPARRFDTELEATTLGDPGFVAFDREFLASWKQDLLDRAWSALEDLEKRTGQPYLQVLRLRVASPDLRSPELAEALAAKLGRSMTAGNLRQILHRARDKFAEFLIDEVRISLRMPTRDEVEEELGEMKLLEFCKPVLNRVKFDAAAN